MAWDSKTAKTTKHTCGGIVFGKKTPGCPRCDELLAGAEPVRWAWTENYKSSEQQDADRREDMRQHFASARHNNPTDPNWCGRVCTAFEW